MTILNSSDVSVIIPCYACKSTIEHTINSVAEQTLLPSEVICIYDCSNDGSLEVLHKIKDRYSDGWLNLIELSKNSGPSIARNKGWEIAKNKYIAFLDADDIWHPKKIELQYKYMEENPDIFLTGHLCPVFMGSYTNIEAITETIEISKNKLFLSNRFLTPSVMLRNNNKFRFTENKDYAEDYLLWFEIIFSGNRSVLINDPLAYLLKENFGGGGLTENLNKLDKGIRDTFWTLYTERKINIVTAILLQIYAKIKHFRRLLITKLRNIIHSIK